MAREPSELERTFETLWRQLDGPELVAEYRFHDTRDWRFDFAHPATLVAIELDGGTWGVINPKTGKRVPGGHTSGTGYRNGCEKGNAATADGWALFHFTPDMLRDDPITNLTPVMDVIKYRNEDWQ